MTTALIATCQCILDIRSSHIEEAFCLKHSQYHLYCKCKALVKPSIGRFFRMSLKEAAKLFPSTCDPHHEYVDSNNKRWYDPPEWVTS